MSMILLGIISMVSIIIDFHLLLLLSLAPQHSLGLGLFHKIWLNFLEVPQQFSFLQGRVVSPTPNPHPGGSGLCIYIPQREGGPVISLDTHFIRLLRHAWVTVGLFLFSSHHTGKQIYYRSDFLHSADAREKMGV
jgi:hypothetical protein